MSEEIKKKRGRPPKEKSATQEQLNIINNAIQSLGIGESIEDFAQNYITDNQRKTFSKNLLSQIAQAEELARQMGHLGTYNPLLSQQMYQNITMRPLPATSEQIESWLLNPAQFSRQLSGVSQYLSYCVGQYNQVIWHSNTSKSFHYELIPADCGLDNCMNEKSYLHSYNICLRTLKKLNIKYQLSKIDLDVSYNGVHFCWFSETNDSIFLTPLPREYCYITAPWDYGFLFAIDLTYFDRFIAMDIAIPELYDAYQQLVDARKAGLKGEELASIQYYNVPPNKGWCFVYNVATADKIPPFVASLGSALDILSYKQLLKNKVILGLYKLIALKIPLNKETNKLSINYNEAKEMTQVIQSTLPDGMLCYSSPFDSEAINANQTERMDDIINIGNNSFAASSGNPDAMFGGVNVRQGSALTLIDKINFYKNSVHMYHQFENFVNWMLALKTRTFSFQVRFFGNNITENEDIKLALEAVRTGNVPYSYLLSYLYEPHQQMAMLKLEKLLGIKELATPLVSGFNTKGGAVGGRPQQTELKDEGISQRDYESNLNR